MSWHEIGIAGPGQGQGHGLGPGQTILHDRKKERKTEMSTHDLMPRVGRRVVFGGVNSSVAWEEFSLTAVRILPSEELF